MAMIGNKNDWQTKCSNIRSRGGMLYQNAHWTDCKFLVGMDESNQKLFEGHKLILAMSSPVFEIMFYGSLPETKIISVSDITPPVFEIMMTYLYTDNLSMGSLENQFELYYAAKKYMIPHLQEECINQIIRELQPQNVCKIYEFARMYQEKSLAERCLNTFETKTRGILADKSFMNADLNTVLTIYSLDRLNIQNELDLYVKLNEYAVKNGYILETNINNEESEMLEEDPINKSSSSQERILIPKELREAVRKIRFLTLSPQQLSELPNKFGLITESETLSIVMNIVSPTSKMFPMPEGFTDITGSRCYYYHY